MDYSKSFMKPILVLLFLMPGILIAALQEPAELAELRARATLGDAEAQFQLGNHYSKQAAGYSQSTQWWRDAAEQGNTGAQRALAEAGSANYNKKYGDPEWLKWMQRAAEAKDLVAQRLLAEAYAKGEHMPVDPAKAFAWRLKAGEQGGADDFMLVGKAYARGTGTQNNPGEAAKWFRKAALHGQVEAMALLGDAYFNGDGVPRDYQEALAWYRVKESLSTPSAGADRNPPDALIIDGKQNIDKARKIVGPAGDMTAQRLAETIIAKISAEQKADADREAGRVPTESQPGKPDEAGSCLAGLFKEVSALKSVDRPPRLRLPIPPVYPREMLSTGIKGYADVEFIVAPNGRVAWASVTKSSHPAFEAPALEAVLKWHFLPAQKSGRAITMKVRQRLDFSPAEHQEAKK